VNILPPQRSQDELATMLVTSKCSRRTQKCVPLNLHDMGNLPIAIPEMLY